MYKLLAIITILFCSIFIGFAILVIYNSIKDINDPANKINWKKRKATITKLKEIEYFKQVVHYKYKYKKSEFKKKDTINNISNIEINKEFYVWINPNNPTENILKKEKTPYENLKFGFGFLILPLSLTILALISIFSKPTIYKIKIIE